MSDNVIELKPQQQEVPSLTLNELTAMIRIIDVVSRRGAFEGAELSDVGALRSKILAFINANAPKEEAPATQEEPAKE
jgi:hypothetical protein